MLPLCQQDIHVRDRIFKLSQECLNSMKIIPFRKNSIVYVQFFTSVIKEVFATRASKQQTIAEVYLCGHQGRDPPPTSQLNLILLLYSLAKQLAKTRLHSSRMHTSPSLTVSGGGLPARGGMCLPGGSACRGGVLPALRLGWYPSMH